MPRHGFRFGFQWMSEMSPGSRGMTLLICALALIALGLIVVPWNNIFPPPSARPAPVPVARVLPAPSPSPAATQVIQVTGEHGAVCIVPTSKARRPVTLVKVP
jgi:hypothetical protein